MFFLHIICDCLITLWQVRTILDINCGFGSFAAHLASLKIMTVCIAPYEATGSQVQLALERGLPAVIGNFVARQLSYPSLSYDMVHCAQCGIIWDGKGNYIILYYCQWVFTNHLCFLSSRLHCGLFVLKKILPSSFLIACLLYTIANNIELLYELLSFFLLSNIDMLNRWKVPYRS